MLTSCYLLIFSHPNQNNNATFNFQLDNCNWLVYVHSPVPHSCCGRSSSLQRAIRLSAVWNSTHSCITLTDSFSHRKMTRNLLKCNVCMCVIFWSFWFQYNAKDYGSFVRQKVIIITSLIYGIISKTKRRFLPSNNRYIGFCSIPFWVNLRRCNQISWGEGQPILEIAYLSSNVVKFWSLIL